MSASPSPLDNLHVASPCHASWDAMTGDDKARFCRTCQKNVFNLSLMTRAEAEALIREKEGKLCVRFARREDGTILTDDCPVGWERAKIAALRPWRFLAAGVAAVIVALVSALGVAPQVAAQPPINQNTESASDDSTDPSGDPIEQPAVKPTATPTATPQQRIEIKMGDVAVQAPRATMGEPAAVPTTPPANRAMTMGGPSAGPFPPAIMGRPAMLPHTMGKPAMPSPAPTQNPISMGVVLPTMGQPVASPTAPATPKTVKKATKPARGKKGARR